jgi:hypothetical protein
LFNFLVKIDKMARGLVRIEKFCIWQELAQTIAKACLARGYPARDSNSRHLRMESSIDGSSRQVQFVSTFDNKILATSILSCERPRSRGNSLKPGTLIQQDANRVFLNRTVGGDSFEEFAFRHRSIEPS